MGRRATQADVVEAMYALFGANAVVASVMKDDLELATKIRATRRAAHVPKPRGLRGASRTSRTKPKLARSFKIARTKEYADDERVRNLRLLLSRIPPEYRTRFAQDIECKSSSLERIMAGKPLRPLKVVEKVEKGLDHPAWKLFLQ